MVWSSLSVDKDVDLGLASASDSKSVLCFLPLAVSIFYNRGIHSPSIK